MPLGMCAYIQINIIMNQHWSTDWPIEKEKNKKRRNVHSPSRENTTLSTMV
jgi:hypothetical protein